MGPKPLHPPGFASHSAMAYSEKSQGSLNGWFEPLHVWPFIPIVRSSCYASRMKCKEATPGSHQALGVSLTCFVTCGARKNPCKILMWLLTVNPKLVDTPSNGRMKLLVRTSTSIAQVTKVCAGLCQVMRCSRRMRTWSTWR